MAGELQLYIDILSDKAGALSAISALQTLDSTVKKNDASIKALEKTYADATAAAQKARAAGDMTGAAKATQEATKAQEALAKTREKQAVAVAKQDLYKKGLDKQVEATRAAQAAEAQRAAQSKGLVSALESIKGNLGGLAEQAKSAGGPVGSLVGKLEGLGKGGAVGIAIAIAVALGALAVAGAYAAVSMTKFAISASDAARNSRLLSEAALGSAAAGNELEQVVDQMTSLAPGLSAKLKEVGRGFADVGIRGRDAQRALEAFGLVATARGEQAAGAIKNIAETSRVAGRLMLGPLNRITGEFDSLKGTGIKAEDVFRALAVTTGKSAAAFKNATTTGIVPFKEGLKAVELAAHMALSGVVSKQVMSLSAQMEKLRENVSKLFSGVAIETFLAGLKTVTDLFDQNTVTGYVLREVFTAVFTKIAALAALAFPYIVAGIRGVVLGVIIFANVAKQAYKAISEFVGTGNKVDNIALAFKVGVGIVATLVGSVLALAAAFAFLGTIALIATAPLWVPIAITAVVIYGAIKAISAFIDAVTSIGESIAKVDLAASAGKMIDGLIKGIKSKIADVRNAVLEVSSAITGAFDSDQEIKSPGRKAMRQGKNVALGWGIGGEQAIPMVVRSTDKVSGAMTRTLDDSDEPRQGGQARTDERPTFSFTECVFGSMTQAQWEEMATAWYLKQSRGNAVTT